MERLTARYNGHAIMAWEHENKYTTEEWIDMLTARLAAYEDTGLEPEEIEQLPSEWMQKVKELEAIGDIDRLRELAEADKEGRPVEVAVERDEGAVDAARAEVQAEWEKKLAAKQAELDATEKDKAALAEKVKSLKDKAKNAGTEDKAAKEELTAEVAGLRKQLAMSGKEMTEFKLRFELWQGAFAPVKNALEALDEETRGKMLGAVKAQLDAWGKVLG